VALSDIEWPILKSALIAFAIALGIAGVAVGVTESDLQRLRAENEMKQQAVVQARDQYYAVVQERQLVDEYWPAYRKLEAMGFIGEENRLDWVDVLRDIARRHRIIAMNYEVQPRAQQTIEGVADVGNFNLQSSEMSLRMSGLHEGNMLDLLKDLGEQKVGLFSLRSCRFERMTEDIAVDDTSPNLSATCTLVWHSIQPGAPPT
jgi:hypothetical protein